MNCAGVLGRSAGASALVVGDVCLDRWCRYDSALAEPSRETGIPRCAVVDTEVTPGAAGTVAANLAALGARRVAVLGTIGQDGFGHELRLALARKRIEGDLLLASDALQTFTYTKLIRAETGAEDLPRIDFVNAAPLEPDLEERLVDRFLAVAAEFDIVIVADQAETAHGGVVTPKVREAVCRAAERYPDAVMLADSRARVQHFRNVIATPNEAEAAEACRQEFGTVDYGRLQRKIGGPALVVTAGARGAWLVDRAGCRLVATTARGKAVDVCGAGDSLAAGLALALFAGENLDDALRFGIIVAGITVGKSGTGAATPEEVLAAAGSGLHASVR